MGDSSRRSRSRSRSPRRSDRKDHKDRDRKHRSDDRDRRSTHRDGDRDRDRDRERDRDRDRDRHRDRDRDHDRDRDRERRHKSRHSPDERDETEEERRERKRARRERERERDERRERRRDKDRGKRREGVEVVDDDGDMWVEKEIDAVSALGTIPTADSLPLKSTAASGAKSPPAVATETTERREAWMLGPDDDGGNGGTLAGDAPVRSAGSGDFFSSMGLERKRKDPNDKKPDPAKVVHSKYELNTQLLEGKQVDEYKTDEKKTTVPGGPGYQWRMMKLRRLYEQAEEQGRPVEDIALERYGSLDEFNEALEERRVLDERDARRARRRESSHSSGMHTPDARGTPSRRFVFHDDSRPGSRQGFRRPGEEPGAPSSSGAGGGHHTPGAGGRTPLGRVEALRSGQRGANANPNAGSKPQTPIPSVFTPQALTRGPSGEAPQLKDTRGEAVMTIEQLNRLQAKVLRAKLSDDPDAEALEDQYERERARFDEAGGVAAADAAADGLLRTAEDGTQTKIEVVPTLDGQGRMYDVGTGNQDAPVPRGANGRKKKDPKFETRDRQGNLLRYNADDDEVTLGELVRQERFGAGAADQKNLDAEFAAQIARDGRFSNDLEYMDDNADKLARKRMKTDAMKRAFAINDYQRTKRAMDECPFCFQDETGRPPLTAVVALGKRTYLCCTLTEELVPGHCLIVPIQHCLSTLELDDDDWDEIRNFMKCLMRMFAAENRGVLFYETILSHRQQRHTYIECVPLPADQFTDAPAYFRSSILASESEWSQHKKLIDFSARPGGFRRALVPNLPYFAVMWDYKGEKGYGHVIEGIEEAAGRGGDDDMGGMDEGDKGGGRFPPYFAAEIIGNVLDLEPRKWLRPKRIDYALNKERARGLGTQFQPYNWTVQLQEGA